MKRSLCMALAILLSADLALGKELKSNATYFPDAPNWLTLNRVDRVVGKIETFMEWSIRRVHVHWYLNQADFEKLHGNGSTVLAFARRSDNTVHIGPKVVNENFDAVFGHEMTHIISFQKYKGAIPAWLEEGLANHLSKHGKVDYDWLARQPTPEDVRNLTHPFRGDAGSSRYHYVASQALIEMIASKCDLNNLLRLSVGRKLEDYLANICSISDVNSAFKTWVSKHKHAGK